MTNAFPHDLLRPISCSGFSPHSNAKNNPQAEHVGITAIDALDTLSLVNETLFNQTLIRVVNLLPRGFDLDLDVSVFEFNIRVLGALLSSHLQAERLLSPLEYTGRLLWLAQDLGERLLVAFHTPTGLPYGTVNLRFGVPDGETTITSTASCGSFLLEYAALSRLTGDEKFENAALASARKLFELRAPETGLPGSHIDIVSGKWTYQDTSIGNYVDSYVETLLKYHILFAHDDDPQHFLMFINLYASFTKQTKFGQIFYRINMHDPQSSAFVLDSLAAFFPSLMTLLGHVDASEAVITAFYSIWKAFGGLPETFHLAANMIFDGSFPLRPELFESVTYALAANPVFVNVLADMYVTLLQRATVTCGLASLKNVTTGELDDYQESFVLAETLKYVWMGLCMSPQFMETFVLTTEAHLLPHTLPTHHARAQAWQKGVPSPPPPPPPPGFMKKSKAAMIKLSIPMPTLRYCPITIKSFLQAIAEELDVSTIMTCSRQDDEWFQVDHATLMNVTTDAIFSENTLVNVSDVESMEVKWKRDYRIATTSRHAAATRKATAEHFMKLAANKPLPPSESPKPAAALLEWWWMIFGWINWCVTVAWIIQMVVLRLLKILNGR